jgi:acyl-CoA reductase-like NAD-dependent aldehyde dehydrogenase
VLIGANLAHVITELGGKAPMIIFDDADIAQAVNGAAFATFVASGQTCIMGARLLVHHKIYERFVQALSVKAATLKLGDPFDNSTHMGPVISRNSRNRIAAMVDEAKSAGANILTGAIFSGDSSHWVCAFL